MQFGPRIYSYFPFGFYSFFYFPFSMSQREEFVDATPDADPNAVELVYQEDQPLEGAVIVAEAVTLNFCVFFANYLYEYVKKYSNDLYYYIYFC